RDTGVALRLRSGAVFGHALGHFGHRQSRRESPDFARERSFQRDPGWQERDHFRRQAVGPPSRLATHARTGGVLVGAGLPEGLTSSPGGMMSGPFFAGHAGSHRNGMP